MSKDFIERPRKNEKDGAITYVQELLKQAREDRRNEDVDKLENLIRLLNTKKYGLVWEEHAELVEEEMKTKIPVFVEDESKQIVGNPDSEDYNFLLEGDNLHSLHLLEKTHANKIDIIYIDPPYNTGNEFNYNDKRIAKEDSYRHSKWLSFMNSRLKLAKRLLNQNGLIFVSIDDKEQSNLMVLMREIFGESNFIAQLIWKKKKGGGNDSKYIATEHEYILVFAKNEGTLDKIFLPHDKDYLKRYKEVDEIGMYFWDTFKRKSGKQYYPITCPDGTVLQYDEDGNAISWLRSEKRFYEDLKKGEVRIIKVNDKWTVHFKQRVPNGKKPRSILDNYGTTSDGSATLEKVLKKVGAFDNPKPIELIKHLISYKSKNAIILDFFAGSGTTGHAVVQLNKQDGGNRKFILCTNNENDICEQVTYKRLFNIQEESPHNLKYFKTDFVDKEEFPDVTLEYELLNYVTPLVELEFGVDISNPKVQVILSEEQLDEMEESDFIEKSTIFYHPEVFFDAKQERILLEKNIIKQEIPDYYFGKDIWS